MNVPSSPTPSPPAAPRAEATRVAVVPPTNYLQSADGRIATAVGVYYSLRDAVPQWEAVLDLRMKMVQYYFDGHNPGIFTPLLDEQVGSVLDYWDGSGTRHLFRVIAIRSWQRMSGEPPPVAADVVAQFQTCRTADGTVDWIYDAVAA